VRFYQDKDGDYWIRDDNDPYDMAYCLGAELDVDGIGIIKAFDVLVFAVAEEKFGLVQIQIAGG
jgi:hypothetical protein